MKLRKLLLTSFAALLCAATASAQVAGVLYSFESEAPRGTYSETPSVVIGFLDASVLTRSGSGNTGGEASFTDFNGTLWTGSGNQNTPGNSLAWTGGASQVSGFFEFTLDTTGVSDLSVRLAVRAAGTGAMTSFSSFSYNLGAGAVEITEGITNYTAGSAFSQWSVDLTSIGASINNQESVTFRWEFDSNISGTSLRVDNIQVTGVVIPEPSTYVMLFGLAALGLALSRRRGSRS